MDRSAEPGDGGERELLLGWLAFHRDALAAKCAGVDAVDLVRTGVAGTTMSLLGLVRHLTEMERVYSCTPGSDEPVPHTPVRIRTTTTTAGGRRSPRRSN